VAARVVIAAVSIHGESAAATAPLADGIDADPALRILGGHGQVLDAVARDVYEAARLGEVPAEETGLFVGMGMVDGPEDLVAAHAASQVDGQLDVQKFFSGAYRSIHPLWPLAMLNNVAAGQIATDLHLRGDNVVLASEADAGVRTLVEAQRAIDAGAARAALCAGVSETAAAAPARMRAQLRGAAQAQEQRGAACVLESETSARERGVAPIAFLVAGATTFEHGAGDAGQRAVHTVLGERDPATVDRVYATGAFRPALEALGLEPQALTDRDAAHDGACAAVPYLDLAYAARALAAGEARLALVVVGATHGGCGAVLLEAP